LTGDLNCRLTSLLGRGGADRGARLDPPREGDPGISRVRGEPVLGLAFSGERAYGPAIGARGSAEENPRTFRSVCKTQMLKSGAVFVFIVNNDYA
jgi:hypothetical protein